MIPGPGRFIIWSASVECDPHWNNVVLAMHMDTAIQSALAIAVADGTAAKQFPYLDIGETGEETWHEYFSEYGADAVLSYVGGNGISAEDTGVLATKTLPFNPSLSYRFTCANTCWTGDISNIDLEFLNASDAVVCAVRNIDSSHEYASDLFYGASLSSLAQAGQAVGTFNNQSTIGYITFTDTAIVFTSTAASEGYTAFNNSFSFNCAANTITQVRISNVQAKSNYTGGSGCTAYVAFHKRKTFTDLIGHTITAYGYAVDVSGTSDDVSMLGGSAGYFGGSHRVAVADSTDFTFAGDFAIELQAKTVDDTAYTSVFSNISLSSDSWANGVDIYTQGGLWKADLYDSAASKTTVTGGSVAEVKQHISLNRVGTTVKLYVDGVGGSGVTWTDTLNAKGITIGNAWDTATRGWVGLVNEVQMYNTGIRTANFTPPTAPFAEVAC